MGFDVSFIGEASGFTTDSHLAERQRGFGCVDLEMYGIGKPSLWALV